MEEPGPEETVVDAPPDADEGRIYDELAEDAAPPEQSQDVGGGEAPPADGGDDVYGDNGVLTADEQAGLELEELEELEQQQQQQEEEQQDEAPLDEAFPEVQQDRPPSQRLSGTLGGNGQTMRDAGGPARAPRGPGPLDRTKIRMQKHQEKLQAKQDAEEVARQRRVKEYFQERRERAHAAAKYLKTKRAELQEDMTKKLEELRVREAAKAQKDPLAPKPRSSEQLRQQAEMAERGRQRYEDHMAIKRTLGSYNNSRDSSRPANAVLPKWATDPKKAAMMMEIDDLLLKKKYDVLEQKVAEADGHGLPLNKAKRALQLHAVLASVGDGCLQEPEVQLPQLAEAVKEAALAGLRVTKARMRLELERAMTMSDARSMQQVVETAEQAGLPVGEHRKKVVRVKVEQLVERLEGGGLRAPKLEEVEAAIEEAAGHGADILLAAHVLNLEAAFRTGVLPMLLQAIADAVLSLTRSERAASRVFQNAWGSALAQVQDRLRMEASYTVEERAGVLCLAASVGMIDLEAELRKVVRGARLRQLAARSAEQDQAATALLGLAMQTAAATGVEAAVQTRIGALLEEDEMNRALEEAERFGMEEWVAQTVVGDMRAEIARGRRGMSIAAAYRLAQEHGDGNGAQALLVLQKTEGQQAVDGLPLRLLEDFTRWVGHLAAGDGIGSRPGTAAGPPSRHAAHAPARSAAPSPEPGAAAAAAHDADAAAGGEGASETGDGASASAAGDRPAAPDRPPELIVALEHTVPLGVTISFMLVLNGVSQLRWLGMVKGARAPPGALKKVALPAARTGRSSTTANVVEVKDGVPGTAADLRAALREAVSRMAKPKTAGVWMPSDMKHVTIGNLSLTGVVTVEVRMHRLCAPKSDIASLFKERDELRNATEAFWAQLAAKADAPSDLFGPEVGSVTVSEVQCRAWDRPVLPERLRQAVCLLFKRLEVEDDTGQHRRTLRKSLLDTTDPAILRVLVMAARQVTYGYAPFGRAERRVVVKRLPEALAAAIAARSAQQVAEVRELLGAMDLDYEAAQMQLLESILRQAQKRKALREESEEEVRQAVPLLGIDVGLRVQLAQLLAAGDATAANQAEAAHKDLGMDTAAVRAEVALTHVALALDAGDAARLHQAVVLSTAQLWSAIVAAATAAGTQNVPSPFETAVQATVRRKLAEVDKWRDAPGAARLAAVVANSVPAAGPKEAHTPPEKLARVVVVQYALRACHSGMIETLMSADATRRDLVAALPGALSAAVERCSGAGLSGLNVGAVRMLAGIGVQLLTRFEKEVPEELLKELARVLAWAKEKSLSGFERTRGAVVHMRTNRVLSALGGIFFPTDTADLPPQFLPTLEEVGKVLLQLSPVTLVVCTGGSLRQPSGEEGDSDEAILADARHLGYARAKSVIANMVRAYGHAAESLVPVGWAEGESLAQFNTGIAPFGTSHVRFIPESPAEVVEGELRQLATLPILFASEEGGGADDAAMLVGDDGGDAPKKAAVSRRKRTGAEGVGHGGAGQMSKAALEAKQRQEAALVDYTRRTQHYGLVAELRLQRRQQQAAQQAERAAAAAGAGAAGGAGDGADGGGAGSAGGGAAAPAAAAAAAAPAAAVPAKAAAALAAAEGPEAPEQFAHTFCFLHSPTATAELLDCTLLHLRSLTKAFTAWTEPVCNAPEDTPLLPLPDLFSAVYDSLCVVLCLSDRICANESVQFALRAAFALRRRVLVLVDDAAGAVAAAMPDDLAPLLANSATCRVSVGVHMKRDAVVKKLLAYGGINALWTDSEGEQGAADDDNHFMRMISHGGPKPPPMRALQPPPVVIQPPKAKGEEEEGQ